MDKSIKLTIDGREFIGTLNDNQTVSDIIKMLPLNLELQRYAGHEYYGKLPSKPSIKGVTMTSKAHAGGIYYYDGWSAFTVLFGDANIAPYEVVHIGDVQDQIIPFLAHSDYQLTAIIELTN